MNKIYALRNNIIITTQQLEPSAWCSGFLSISYCKQTWWLVLYGTDRYNSGVELSARKQISIFLKLSDYFFDQEFAGKSDQFAWSRNLNAVYQYKWKVQSSESSWSEFPEASWLHFHKVSFQSADKSNSNKVSKMEVFFVVFFHPIAALTEPRCPPFEIQHSYAGVQKAIYSFQMCLLQQLLFNSNICHTV